MVTVTVQIADAVRGVDLDLHVADGETVALVGPNGAGKSTVLGAVAGTTRPAQCHVRVGDEVLADTGLWVPPHRRSVALLAQEPMLFPHLTVLDNVAFGPRSQGQTDARHRAARWLSEIQVSDLAERKPSQLSGGQAQRVALARALAAEPAVVLLDEPMAALDVAAVPQMRRLLHGVLASRTAIVVTHDPLDALVLADRTVVIEAGQIVDDGPTREVLGHPRTEFAALMSGVNLVEGVAIAADRIQTSGGWEVTGLADVALTTGSAVWAAFAPASVAVHRDRPSGSPRNVLAGAVGTIEQRGGTCRLEIGGLLVDLTAAAVAELGLEPGAAVWLSLKATEVRLYSA